MKSLKVRKAEKDLKPYEKELCNSCKENIAYQTSQLSKRALLRPKKIAKKSLEWLCKDCKPKLMRAYK